MTKTTREMVWLQLFLKEVGISSPSPIPMHCDNQAAIFIAVSSTFHEHMKHIEIDYYYIWENFMFKVISTFHVTTSHQLIDVFMKSLARISYEATCTKPGIFYLYAPTWGGGSNSDIEL